MQEQGKGWSWKKLIENVRRSIRVPMLILEKIDFEDILAMRRFAKGLSRNIFDTIHYIEKCFG